MDKIDFVIPWVDGNDPDWMAEKNKYSKEDTKIDSLVNRYRDWDTLKYLFRSIELYTPWVNKIHFVTWGHVPNWLNTNNEKINIVRHEDYIPKRYLPVFSSHPIELNLHRIPGISEKFVYFNDDYILLNKINEEDFFRNGLPCDSGILHIHCEKKNILIHRICNNNVSLINEYFDINNVKKQKINNWFNLKYGIKNNLMNLFLFNCPRFPGFKQYHITTPLTKDAYNELWDKEYEYLDSVCMNKFRNINDVNQWLFREWQLASNKFYPSKRYKQGILIDFDKDDEIKVANECAKIIENSKYKVICINDGNIKEFDTVKDIITQSLEKKFHKKCSMEK